MRPLIITLIMLLCAASAWAGDLNPGTLYVDLHGCEWYVIENSSPDDTVREKNGVKEFSLRRVWRENSYIGHARVGSKEAIGFEHLGAERHGYIWHIDEQGVMWAEYHVAIPKAHIQYFWAVPVGNCRGGRP